MKSLTWPVLIALLLGSGGGAIYAYGQLQPARVIVAGAARASGLLPHRITHAAAPGHARWLPIVLFGEVHDNAAQHAMRFEALKALLLEGVRPALLMEQFDREHQADIKRLRGGGVAPDADQIILAGSGAPASATRRLHWAFYRPLIELALAYDLPIVAANVSRDDARAIIKDGLAAHGFNPLVPADIEQAQADAIERSHCGTLHTAQARRMAAAQIARDQYLTYLVEAHALRGAVPLVGNGHVRVDVGVPRWLQPRTRERTEAIGMLEEGDFTAEEAGAAYDHVFTTPKQLRDDPCKAMQSTPSVRT